MDPSRRLSRVEARVYRQPIAQPVVTSFGTTRDRPAVLVQVEDQDGAQGFGEVWCDFPSVGPERRARLINEVLAPLLLGQDSSDVAALWDILTRRTSGAGIAMRRAWPVLPRPSRGSTSRCGIWLDSAPACRCGSCSAGNRQRWSLRQRHQSR